VRNSDVRPWGCCETLDDLRSFVTSYWDRWEFESFDNGEMKVMVLGPDAAVVAFTQTGVQVDTAGVRQETATDLTLHHSTERPVHAGRSAFTTAMHG